MEDTPDDRLVRVCRTIPVGPDSILTVEDPADPEFPPTTFGALLRYQVGDVGWLQFVPARTYPRRMEGWTFRPAGDKVRTGWPEARTPSPDGSGTAGTTEGG